MIVRILPEAEDELLSAAVWYDTRDPGVGGKMLDAYQVGLNAIRERADRLPQVEWCPVDRDIRRMRMRRFPYQIIYELDDDVAVILAFAHLSQRPHYWIGRRLS